MLPWRQGVGDKVYENECDIVRIAHPEVSLYLICIHTHTHKTHTHYIALYVIRPTGYRRVPFSRATNFANGARKGVCGNYFHQTTLAELFTIHVNLHAMEFPLIFGETNFVKVPKIHEIYGPQKRVPYGKFLMKYTAIHLCTLQVVVQIITVLQVAVLLG